MPKQFLKRKGRNEVTSLKMTTALIMNSYIFLDISDVNDVSDVTDVSDVRKKGLPQGYKDSTFFLP